MSDKVIATFLWMEILRERLEFQDVNPDWYKAIKAMGLEKGLQYYQLPMIIQYVKRNEEFSEKVIKWIQTAMFLALGVRIHYTWFGFGSHPLSDLNEKGPVRLIAFLESQKTTTVNYPNNISNYLVEQFKTTFPKIVTIKTEQDKEEHELNYTPEFQQQELLIKKKKQQELKETEEQELLLKQDKERTSEVIRLQEDRAQVEELQQEEQKSLVGIQSNLPGPKSQEDQEKENKEQQKREEEAQKRVAELQERETAALQLLEQKQQQEKQIQTAKFEKIDEKFNQEQEYLSQELNEKRKEREIIYLQQLENEKLRKTQQRLEEFREFREREREKLRETSIPVPKLGKQIQPSRFAQYWSYVWSVSANAPQPQPPQDAQDVLLAFITNPDNDLSPESLSVLRNAIQNADLKLPATESKESRDFWAQATQNLNDKPGLLNNLYQFMSDYDI